MSLCKYKGIFGNPNEGLHKYRMFNVAIFDVISTIIVGIIIYQFIIINIFKMQNTIKLWMVLAILFISGIFAHIVFCVRTTIDKLLFNE